MFRPTLAKLIVPIGIVGLSLLPIPDIRHVLFGVLGLPFSYTIGLPFLYADKPFYVSPARAVVIALFWAAFIYLIGCLISRPGAAREV